MAEVNLPAVAWQTQVNFHLVKPGEIFHELAFSDNASILERGYGHWQGVTVFGEAYADDADQIEAFLNSLYGRVNFVELPIHRATIDAATSVSSHMGDVYTLAGDPGALKVGAYVRAGNRLLQITEVAGGPTVKFVPDPVLADLAPISPAATVRAASVRNSPISRRTTEWGGPWAWNWAERLF